MSLLAHEERSVTQHMPRVATVVPEETDILCEGCGYTLNGLPESSNCPECGKPIAESVGTHRHGAEFESAPSALSFLATTRLVILAPGRFYRELATRAGTTQASGFARAHRWIASVLFALATAGHSLFVFYAMFYWVSDVRAMWYACPVIFGLATPLIYLLLTGLTRLATWLSAIEARYWGMRLPQAVVRRGLQFHAAHYLPVALLAVLTVWGYRAILATIGINHRYDDIYLYTLCGVVVLSALYLFRTYWIAMRSMMFANR